MKETKAKKIKEMKKQKNIKKSRGITLIALVITIIVLLILAGVSIATLTGENGILTRATSASKKTAEVEKKEELQTAVIGSIGKDGNISIEDLNKNLKNIEGLKYNGELISNTEENKIEKLPAKLEIEGEKIAILGNGEVAKVQNVSDIKNNVYAEEKSMVEDVNGKIFILPKGFTIRIDDTTSNADSIEKGIVIEDKDGNQYVWIPVDGILGEDQKKLQNAMNGEIILGRYIFNSNAEIDMELTPDTLDENLKISSDEKYTFTENVQDNDIKEFIKSVRENGGYYIARFEASNGGNNRVESKYNKKVWNEITQQNARSVCKNLYEDINSDLINSYAWDTAILFIQKNAKNNYSRQNSLNTELMNTGKSGDLQCNIFDMSSNCLEWTTEVYSRPGYPYVGNGGHFGYKDAYTNSRNTPAQLSSIYYSFRLVLYL